MKLNMILGSILVLSSSFALSDDTAPTRNINISDAHLQIDGRETDLPDRDVNRSQDRIRVGFTIDAAGIVEIVGMAQTGPSFNNDWNTDYTNKGTKDPNTLAFRQIYLKKVMGPVTVEVGAMSPEATVGAAGLGPTGWMDGMRVLVNTKVGDFKVVGGSLGNFTDTNAFSRLGKFKGNFLEVEMSYTLFKKLMGKTAYERYNGDDYVRQDLEYDLTIFGDKVFKLFADGLMDIQKKAFNYELGIEFDVLKTIVNKYDKRLDLKLYYSNLSSELQDRAPTISAFYTYGPRYTAALSGNIDKKGIVSWFARGTVGQEKRIDIGLSFNMGMKRK